MLDLNRAYERHLRDEAARVARPNGIIAVGFLLMLTGFPVFFGLAFTQPFHPLVACAVSTMLEIGGIGLIAMAQWARSFSVLSVFVLSVVATIHMVVSFVLRVPNTTYDFATKGPMMAVMGLIVAFFVVVIPSYMVMGYLGSRPVRDAFWYARFTQD